MGSRTATETVFALLGAFIGRAEWTQAALARHLEVSVETVRTRLEEIRRAGVPLKRKASHPHVYWRLERWPATPSACVLEMAEVDEILRQLARAPRSKKRDALIEVVCERARRFGWEPAPITSSAPEIADGEDDLLRLLEDAARTKRPLRMKYFTASRRDQGSRDISVHHVDTASPQRFVATSHTDGRMKTFRLNNVSSLAFASPDVHYRDQPREVVQAYVEQRHGGFHSGTLVECIFRVKEPDAAWVVNNLPDARIEHERIPGGIRFWCTTGGLLPIARFVAGLGELAVPESDELASEVARIARGALAAVGVHDAEAHEK